MKMTSEQLEFIRVHGITHYPPGPTFDVSWGSPGGRGPTERDILNRLRSGSGVCAVAGINLKDGNMGRPRIRRGTRRSSDRHRWPPKGGRYETDQGNVGGAAP